MDSSSSVRNNVFLGKTTKMKVDKQHNTYLRLLGSIVLFMSSKVSCRDLNSKDFISFSENVCKGIDVISAVHTDMINEHPVNKTRKLTGYRMCTPGELRSQSELAIIRGRSQDTHSL